MKLKFFFSTIIAATLTAATFAATTPTFDDDITGVKIAAINRTLQVNLSNVTDATIDIRIETTNGAVVHHETVTQMSILKKYDLRQLEGGDYTLIIENGRTKTIQPFILEFGSIKILETERVTKRLPQILQVKTNMDVRVYMTKKSTVSINIVDNQGINVFEEKTEAVSLAKRYNLSKLPSGVYFVQVQADGETQYATIVLD